MIAESQNIILLKCGNAAAENAEWFEFAEYCFEREKGFRKEAFSHLNVFLKNTNSWSKLQKRNFIAFLFQYFENEIDSYGLFPHPLSEKLIKPVLENWCEEETSNSNPFRWCGQILYNRKYIFKALEINPKDDKARNILLSFWTYDLYYSVHHLPEGYIGDYEKDLQLAEKVQKEINLLADIQSQKRWTDTLNEDLELIKNYKEWKNSGHPDLEKWGEENNKIVSYRLSRTYYFDE